MPDKRLLTKEIRQLARKGRFRFLLVLIVLAFVTNGIYFSLEIRQLRQQRGRIEQQLAGNQTLYQVEYLRPLSEMRFMSGGDRFPDLLEFTHGEPGFSWSGAGLVSPADPFINLGLSSIGIYLLSLFALVLGNGLWASERDGRTLPMLFACPIGRLNFLGTKLAAGFLILFSVLSFSLLVHLLVLLSINDIPLTLGLIVSLFRYALLTLVFEGIFLLTGMLAGIFFQDTARALTVAIMVWAVLNVGGTVLFQYSLFSTRGEFTGIGETAWIMQREKARNLKLDQIGKEIEETISTGSLTPARKAGIEKRLQDLDWEDGKSENGLRHELQGKRFNAEEDIYRKFLVVPAVSYQVLCSYTSGEGLFPFLSIWNRRELYRDQYSRFLAQYWPEVAPSLVRSGDLGYSVNNGPIYHFVASFKLREAFIPQNRLPALDLAPSSSDGSFWSCLGIQVVTLSVLAGVAFARFLRVDLRR